MELLSKPGLALQNLTTKEPDDDMIEVAICSVEAVLTGRNTKRKFPGRAIEQDVDKINEKIAKEMTKSNGIGKRGSV